MESLCGDLVLLQTNVCVSQQMTPKSEVLVSDPPFFFILLQTCHSLVAVMHDLHHHESVSRLMEVKGGTEFSVIY